MPASVALLLCTAFVVFLLRLDRKQAPNVSHVLWIPTIWMLSIAGKPMASWFSTPGVDPESGSPLDRAFQTGILIVGLIILARRRLNWSVVMRENTWLMALVGYMLVSVVWSDIPFTSFKRWVREMGGVTMALVIFTEKDRRQAVESLFRRTVYIMIPASILLIKYFPNLGVAFSIYTGDMMWVGVTLQKNGIGRLCAVAAFFLIWTLVRRWQKRSVAVHKYQTWLEIGILALALYMLRGPSLWARSATGITALSIGLIAFGSLLWIRKKQINLGPNFWVAITASLIGLGVITPLVGGSSVGTFAAALGRNATLTGRTDIWAILLPTVTSQPILGCGFGGYWTSQTIAAATVNEAHNGYLDVWLGLGIVGVLLTAGFLLSFCRRAANLLTRDFDWGSLCISYLLMAVVHNISETSFDSFTRHLMAAMLLLSISVPRVATVRVGSYQQDPDTAGRGMSRNLTGQPSSSGI
jgi:exopolysaccharide production protein ExoQ